MDKKHAAVPPPGPSTRQDSINPNNEQAWKERGHPGRPGDWPTRPLTTVSPGKPGTKK